MITTSGFTDYAFSHTTFTYPLTFSNIRNAQVSYSQEGSNYHSAILSLSNFTQTSAYVARWTPFYTTATVGDCAVSIYLAGY